MRSLPRFLSTSYVALALACAGGSGPQRASSSGTTAAEAPAAEAPAASPAPEEDPPGDIPHFADGSRQGTVSDVGAARRRLTLLDLGEAWAPDVFTEDESLGARGRQPYRRRYVRLANEQVREQRRDPTERHLELYGISPSFAVLRERLADEERHLCHDAVDDAPIEALDRSLRPGADMRQQRMRAGATRRLRARLEEAVARRELTSIDELEGDRRHGRDLTRLRRFEPTVLAIRAVQAHLRCEGTLPRRARDGVLDARTGRALRVWQSRHMIISLASRLDEATRATLVMDSRELDFLSVLRALRERVVAATGIIEDGTASNQWGEIVGRQPQVDDEFRWADRLDPLPNGAPDLVSEQTDAAARALGWTDPATTLAWLNEHASERADERVVAIPLPAPPDYHSEQMELRVEIDRGDVWYAFPYTESGQPRGRRQRARPTTTIFAQRPDGSEVALVRWNTTIGGWQPELNPEGEVGLRYKESDVGPRVWRDLIASPAWLPPPNTPDDELLRREHGRWTVNTSITGPGYDSAYGLAMVIHHRVRNDGSEERDWVDNGIRSHGSVSYRSILRGYSHGCHRLFNHLAVRMMGFLLDHRSHTIHGRIPASMRRELHPEPPPPPAEGEEIAEEIEEEEPLVLELTTRGFRFELTPPVPVEVLRGNVRGRPDRPVAGFFPLPEELQAQARAEAEVDPGTSPAQ